MDTFPIEIQLAILSILSYADIKRYSLVSPTASHICNYSCLWSDKAFNQLGTPPEIFFNTQLSPDDRYLQLKYIRKFGGKTLHNSEHLFMSQLVHDGNLDIIIYILKFSTAININTVLTLAAQNQRWDILTWCLENGANNYNRVLTDNYFMNDPEKMTRLFLLIATYTNDIVQLSDALNFTIIALARAGYLETITKFLEIGKERNLLQVGELKMAMLTASTEMKYVLPYMSNKLKKIKNLLAQYLLNMGQNLNLF